MWFLPHCRPGPCGRKTAIMLDDRNKCNVEPGSVIVKPKMVELTRSACRSFQRKTPRPAACECSSSLQPAAHRHWLESPGKCRRGQWPPWRTQLGTDALWRTWGGSLEDVSNWASRELAAPLYCHETYAIHNIVASILPSGEKMVVRESYRRDWEKKPIKKRVLFSKVMENILQLSLYISKYAQLFSLIVKQYLIEVFNIKEIHEHLFF